MNKTTKSVGEVIGKAFVSYIITNADDLVILMNFFTEASIDDSPLKVHHIFIGQYLGFIIILGISLIGYGISTTSVPVEILGFLGFVPIILGIKDTIKVVIKLCGKSKIDINEIIPSDEISIVELETIRCRDDHNGQLTFEFPIGSESKINDASSMIQCKQKFLILLNRFANIQILKVACITLANSGDNVSIYTPLFSEASAWQIIVYVGIFLGLVFVWLIFCYFFINFRPIRKIAQKYAFYIVPIVFIGIGIYIIISSNCFPWLIRAIQTKNFKNG
ncbi:unnamed protein product [Adineta steineri]|uniref:Cadmium resistance transporter n=1 Tax=Adineta steineri TaxID=433720 RepID=A0A815E6C9_9BILA|nr:unnamed protein product [Adineta steineri]CAF1250759.1 unnamed protein product [Adineta steineri]CAF1310518.1 unnamed protein product [Adineta steineri]CAF1536360.1 unnamed protein product [Adineta steineri]CAF3959239.1 unnamed protein product [Adineta steineri]